MQIQTYQSVKLSSKSQKIKDDVLVVEAPLQININNEPYTVIMRTPCDDMELIRGLLFAEDIYKKTKTFQYQIIAEENTIPSIINISIAEKDLGKGYLNKRTLLSVSSCGICGKKELKDISVTGHKIKNSTYFSLSDVQLMQQKMIKVQHTFQQTGGSHAAAIFNQNHKLLSCKEDIGRHNAVDKVVGDLLLNNSLKPSTFLFVSGRVSYEIVSKAFIAKIPIIIAVSACSSLAVDFAKEFGICLIGFTRNNKLTLYAQPSMLKMVENA
ncbi:formate dehydrogenase accessory sulfurtransferase FdhD [Polaribacter porphyrae]|uniref:Sulfur carrier protein FdhD n=1 Tax=Polaribacter porphyrae TaxID=1137780 RepID=A0A2S7WJ82_9FLAO|nr:formate dehydrogenase accessory sulfurtransferase FdhD [Polaribacter porphyrae]PQJ77667.1 formate dehydrogenase family accessory protein FdhD [Polaribacter porphyrae]